ncbi:MAG: type II toxin-antitoxin system death-on-curing family toxin [Chloroflexi bacterium]|nr:type II toxin-antitoxin system death-on-curing family toxin [Chloroflexota bacterium]
MHETTRFVTADELIYINELLVGAELEQKTLLGKQRVRDLDLLAAAVGRPAQTVFGADAFPTLDEKAAALLHAVARYHPFADGNKRTATVGAILMLAMNGRGVAWDAHAALGQIVAMAEGQAEVGDFAAWLVTEPGPSFLQPDADQDQRLIDRILREHDWLLSELASR